MVIYDFNLLSPNKGAKVSNSISMWQSEQDQEEYFLTIQVINGRKYHGKASGTAVLIDIYRSTSTIPTILASGARYVIPTRTIKEAREIKEKNKDALLVGERYGFKIPNFDYNNSPSDIKKVDLTGKIVIFTSTNGTLVLRKISSAERVFIASFVNHSATLAQLDPEEDIQIFVSGRPDSNAPEDEIYADFLRREILGEHPDRQKTLDLVRKCSGSRRLKILGYSEDIDAALDMDSINLAAVYSEGKITEAR